jgi:hypothetical protein
VIANSYDYGKKFYQTKVLRIHTLISFPASILNDCSVLSLQLLGNNALYFNGTPFSSKRIGGSTWIADEMKNECERSLVLMVYPPRCHLCLSKVGCVLSRSNAK